MVVLRASQDVRLPGRYWGEGQGPTASPSQASLLLAKLNERARERKAALGKGTQSNRQRVPEVGHRQVIPEHQLTEDQNKAHREHQEDVISATPKGQHHETPPVSHIQLSGDAKPKVNGIKTEEACTAEEESVHKKKKKRKGVEEEGTGSFKAPGEQGLVGIQDVDDNETPFTKKKKKKRKREEEQSLEEDLVDGRVTCQREELANLQDGDYSEVLVTKKEKKKRKREKEESLIGKEVEALMPLMKGACDVTEKTEESSLIKKKKKKKKMTELINEEDTSVRIEEGTPVKKKNKYECEKGDVEATGGGEESFKDSPEKQRKKERWKGGEEGVEKIIKMEVEEAQLGQINDTHTENNDSLSSPTKKSKGVKSEPKEGEGQQVTSSSFIVPKTAIKEEILDVAEDFEMEQKDEFMADSHVEEGTEETRGKDGEVSKKKTKKKEKKKKTKKKEGKGKNREVAGFTLLTEVEATKRQKIQRTLPHWLANPTVIGRDLMADGTPVDSLPGLDPSLIKLMKQQNVQQLFPVQRAVIPEILAGAGTLACRFQPRDVCVSAPTGSGKTLAYVLPIVQALRSRTVPRIRALILLPVQELATQVFHVFQTYCRGTPLRVGKAVGHSTLQKEQTALVAHHLDCHHSLIDILVATPGRLADHLRMTRGLDLAALRYLVLDEADRMLAAEGGDWVAHVQRAISDHRSVWEGQPLPQPPLQRLLFSATLSSDPEQLQHVTLYHPKLFTVAAPSAGQDKSVAVVIGQYVRPAELKEEYVVVEEEVKPLALHHLLVSGEGRHRVLIFTNSVQATHKLALLLAALSQGSSRVVAEFSSKKNKRQQILSQFASGKIDVLVSSDAMARGLDISDIDHVVSYDVTATTTYVHRIGRTARAGRPGTALSLVTKATMSEFRRALSGGGEGACQLSLIPEELEPYEQQYIDALASLKATLEEEERERRQNHSSGKAKKKKQKKRQRKQKKDLRTTRLARKKASENKGKVTLKANRLHRHLKR